MESRLFVVSWAQNSNRRRATAWVRGALWRRGPVRVPPTHVRERSLENSLVASPWARCEMKFFAEQSYKKFAAPYTLLAACAVLALHAGDLMVWGTRGPGPTLSDLLQEGMGVLCVVAAYKASRISENFGRFFWGLCVVSFSLFVLAQRLASYDSSFRAPHFIEWTVNVLFFFWFTPLAMALFLDVD